MLFLFIILPIFGILSNSNSPKMADMNFPPSSSSSVWDHDSVPVCTYDDRQNKAQMCSDGNGGAIIVWIDYRNDIHGDIYAQLINYRGVCQWNANGVAVCTAAQSQYISDICSDENGGIIVTWTDLRDNYYGLFDIYSQRINSMGNVMWDSNGVLIANDTFLFNPKSCSDGLGGAIITWYEINDTSFIHAQRVGAYGNLLWTPGGVEITATGNSYITEPQICADGNGGAIIAWDDSRNYPDTDLYAQKINSYGVVQWTPNGKLICSTGDYLESIKICRDPHPTGAAFLAWSDWRDYDSNNNFDIYAQRIDMNGDTMWSTDGIRVCTHSKLHSGVNIEMCVDYLNGLIITWEDDKEDEYKIFAQRLSSNGDIRWETGGIRVCSANSAQTDQKLCTNGTGAIYISWLDSRSRAYTQKIKIDGEIIGNSKGYLVSDTGYPQGSAGICTSANDTVIVALVENRGSGQDIYAQRFNIEQYIPAPENGISFGNYYILIYCLSVALILVIMKRKTNKK